MEHATALVVDDATTQPPRCLCGWICGCQRNREAGWSVRCYACGCGVRHHLTAEQAEVDDAIRHRRARVTAAFGEGWSLDMDPSDADVVEAYDAMRDDELVDAYERSVA